MILIPLIFIPVLYLIAAILKPNIKSLLPFNLCAICAAVSLTWIALALFYLMGRTEFMLMIGVLMGMSVAGLMYKAEGIYKNNHIKNFWFVRLVIVVGGFYSVYLFLQQHWSALLLTAIVSILAIAVSSLLFQGITHSQALKEVKKKNAVIQKLEDCC